MSIPRPPIKLEGHCSTINDNTLYVLSPGGFQSLPLKQHAKWSKEKAGVSVTGPACVTVGDGSSQELWVIGGTTKDSSYMGLQKYSFSSKSWETISTSVPVLQSRTDHSAAYLEDFQSILVYAGSQPNAPSILSSQTFLIPLTSPYAIQSFTSEAPTTNLPILTAFNSSSVLMVGGWELNTEMSIFSPTTGWQQLSTTLTGPLNPGVQGTIVDGSDGSKVLEVYDMTVSPNNVTQIVLLDAGGLPAATGQTIGSSGSSKKRKRDLSLSDWPAYNSKNAPTATRTDYGIAQNSNGVVVITGDDTSSPVAMFNQDHNSWVDASKFFDSKDQQPLKPSKTTTQSHGTFKTASATKSSTPSSTTSSASSTAASKAAHARMLRTLGITLGVLCGIAAIFILVLLYLRWRKLKKRKQEGYLDEKDPSGKRLSFQDRGASFMKEAGGSVNDVPPPKKPWEQAAHDSQSSLAIITGKFKRTSNNHSAKPSYDSTTRLVKDRGISEPMEMVDIGKQTSMERPMTARNEPRPPAAHYGPTLTEDDARSMKSMDSKKRNRSSGWSKYFATSQPTGPNGLSHLPSAYAKANAVSDGSAYSTDRLGSQLSQIPSSALVPPLDIDFSKTIDGQRLSHVATGSPSFNDSREDLARGMGVDHNEQSGVIINPKNRASHPDSISSYNRSTMSSTLTSEYYNESATPWTPTSTSFKDHLVSRPPSSVYTESQRVPSRGKSAGFFPGPGTSHRPSKAKLSHVAAPSSDWAAPTAGLKTQTAEDRDSNITVFPRGVPSAHYPGRQKAEEPPVPNTDLGWLNLGLNGSQNRL